MQQFKFIDLFCGIGGIRIPFEENGGTCVFSSEIDKYAQQTYEANFGEKPQGDITKIEPQTIPDHDILLAGFPCQPFSIIGEKKGFLDTRGTLFFNIENILRAKKPKCFLLENVKGLRSHDNGKTFKTIITKLEQMDYKVYSTVLNSLDFGIPQKRERTYIVGFLEDVDFTFPTTGSQKLTLEDILEPEEKIDKSLFVSETILNKRMQKVKKGYVTPSIWHENKTGNISALPYSCALRAGGSYNYLLINGVRRPSARELLRLQGFPENYKIVVSYTQHRKQLGNSVSVPVIREIAKNILKVFNIKTIDLKKVS